MKAKVYYPDKIGGRKALNRILSVFAENDIEYEEFDLTKKRITWEQLMEILMYTEEGVSDIIATQSHDYKRLIEEGVDFEDLTLTELQRYIIQYPKLIKTPVVVYKNTTIAGYDQEAISLYRKRRREKSLVKW
ncbi:gp564 [Bacillus phage G]|uniref:Gp564 n=1 Tax=Bacillus phage G TaxID=2884420 RepID=G3MAU4_9CAUD|nr:gp564 [Bacillus phage G]AEO93810.1 gp564 [Bacillus phage G]